MAPKRMSDNGSGKSKACRVANRTPQTWGDLPTRTYANTPKKKSIEPEIRNHVGLRSTVGFTPESSDPFTHPRVKNLFPIKKTTAVEQAKITAKILLSKIETGLMTAQKPKVIERQSPSTKADRNPECVKIKLFSL